MNFKSGPASVPNIYSEVCSNEVVEKACLSGVMDDGNFYCSGKPKNSYEGAGACERDEKQEYYSCGESSTCLREWSEWTCYHLTQPNAGCKSKTIQTTVEHSVVSGAHQIPEDERLEIKFNETQAREKAIESAAAQCCPCGGKDPVFVGAEAGRGPNYVGYACQCS